MCIRDRNTVIFTDKYFKSPQTYNVATLTFQDLSIIYLLNRDMKSIRNIINCANLKLVIGGSEKFILLLKENTSDLDVSLCLLNYK